MVTIDRERLISEKRNNKVSAEGMRLPKEEIVCIYSEIKVSLNSFVSKNLLCFKFFSTYLRYWNTSKHFFYVHIKGIIFEN